MLFKAFTHRKMNFIAVPTRPGGAFVHVLDVVGRYYGEYTSIPAFKERNKKGIMEHVGEATIGVVVVPHTKHEPFKPAAAKPFMPPASAIHDDMGTFN